MNLMVNNIHHFRISSNKSFLKENINNKSLSKAECDHVLSKYLYIYVADRLQKNSRGKNPMAYTQFLNLSMAKAGGFRQQSQTAYSGVVVGRFYRSRGSFRARLGLCNKHLKSKTCNTSDWLPNLAFAKPSCKTFALAKLPTVTCYDIG